MTTITLYPSFDTPVCLDQGELDLFHAKNGDCIPIFERIRKITGIKSDMILISHVLLDDTVDLSGLKSLVTTVEFAGHLPKEVTIKGNFFHSGFLSMIGSGTRDVNWDFIFECPSQFRPQTAMDAIEEAVSALKSTTKVRLNHMPGAVFPSWYTSLVACVVEMSKV